MTEPRFHAWRGPLGPTDVVFPNVLAPRAGGSQSVVALMAVVLAENGFHRIEEMTRRLARPWLGRNPTSVLATGRCRRFIELA